MSEWKQEEVYILSFFFFCHNTRLHNFLKSSVLRNMWCFCLSGAIIRFHFPFFLKLMRNPTSWQSALQTSSRTNSQAEKRLSVGCQDFPQHAGVCFWFLWSWIWRRVLKLKWNQKHKRFWSVLVKVLTRTLSGRCGQFALKNISDGAELKNSTRISGVDLNSSIVMSKKWFCCSGSMTKTNLRCLNKQTNKKKQ